MRRIRLSAVLIEIPSRSGGADSRNGWAVGGWIGGGEGGGDAIRSSFHVV